MLPMTKNTAGTFFCFKMSKIFGVHLGSGPSSKEIAIFFLAPPIWSILKESGMASYDSSVKRSLAASYWKDRRRRSFQYDAASDLFTDESYDAIPLSFNIDQIGGAKKKIAISFDDGPDPRWTPKILDILKQKNVPAVFFVI